VKTQYKAFVLFISLVCFSYLIGCGGGGGGGAVVGAVSSLEKTYSILGSISMPINQSATATANIRCARTYSGFQAKLLNSAGVEIVSAVSIGNTGDYMFSGVPAGSNYQIVIASPANKTLLVKILDSVSNDQAGLSVDVNSTAVSSLVLSSNFALTAAQVQAASNKGDVNLSGLISAVENWLCGILINTSSSVLAVVKQEVGQSAIDQMINNVNKPSSVNDATVPIYTVAQEFFPIQKGNKWVYDVIISENSVVTNTEYSFEILDHTWLEQGSTIIPDKTTWLASSSVSLYGSNEVKIFLDKLNNSIKMRGLIFLPGDDREIAGSLGTALFTGLIESGTISFSQVSSTQIKMSFSGSDDDSYFSFSRSSEYIFTKGVGITRFRDSSKFAGRTTTTSGSLKSKTLN